MSKRILKVTAVEIPCFNGGRLCFWIRDPHPKGPWAQNAPSNAYLVVHWGYYVHYVFEMQVKCQSRKKILSAQGNLSV